MHIDQCLAMISSLESPPFLIARQPSRYPDFLQLYNAVGYSPDPAEASSDAWRNASSAVWRRLDTRLPATCTGAAFDDRLVSSWGMIPYSRTVVYAHSVCMEKTLAGALTLFYQSIQSLRWLDEAHGFCYYGGSYNKSSSFVTNFQNLDVLTNEQVRIDATQFDPIGIRRGAPFESLLVEELSLSADRETNIPDQYASLIGQNFVALDGLHKVRQYKIVLKSPARIVAHFIHHDASAFLTASNILQYSWLFVERWDDVKYLIPAIRQIGDFSATGIQVVCEKDKDGAAFNLVGERATEIFWIFTPASLRAELLSSFTSAFKKLIGRFKEEEVDTILRQLNR